MKEEKKRDVLFYFFIHIKYRRWDLVKKEKMMEKKKHLYSIQLILTSNIKINNKK